MLKKGQSHATCLRPGVGGEKSIYEKVNHMKMGCSRRRGAKRAQGKRRKWRPTVFGTRDREGLVFEQ